MSKCREAFEAECERLGLRTEQHWYDCGSRMKYVYPEEMYPLIQAIWNARGSVDKRIVREHSFKIQSGSPHRKIFEDAKEAIEQEQCK